MPILFSCGQHTQGVRGLRMGLLEHHRGKKVYYGLSFRTPHTNVHSHVVCWLFLMVVERFGCSKTSQNTLGTHIYTHGFHSSLVSKWQHWAPTSSNPLLSLFQYFKRNPHHQQQMRDEVWDQQRAQAQQQAWNRMQGWESECWLDLAKGGWVWGILTIELKRTKMSISLFLKDIDPRIKIFKNC